MKQHSTFSQNWVLFAWLIAALEVIAFGASTTKHFISGEHGGLLGILWHQFKYFTLWTNVLIMVLFAQMAFKRHMMHDAWLAALTLWLLIVMAVFHLLLGNDEPQRGFAWISDTLFHTVNPILLTVFWIALVPKAGLLWRHAVIWLLWPLLYVIYAVTRGIFTSDYPYFFVDLDALGWAGLFGWALKFLIAFYVMGVLIIGVGKLISRMRPVQN